MLRRRNVFRCPSSTSSVLGISQRREVYKTHILSFIAYAFDSATQCTASQHQQGNPFASKEEGQHCRKRSAQACQEEGKLLVRLCREREDPWEIFLRLYVDDIFIQILHTTTEAILYDHFKSCGGIVDINIRCIAGIPVAAEVCTSTARQDRWYATVQFKRKQSVQSVKNALQLDGQVLGGRQLKVQFCVFLLLLLTVTI